MIKKILDFINLHLGEENHQNVLENVRANISFRGSNLWILACAILIASIGLNVNSTAVIIGAMLISPLMGPIVGAGFALATFNFELLKKSIKNLLIATIVSLIVSSLFFFLSPFKEVQSELLARTSPNIYDVLIAFFGGIVGAISITRKEKGNPIPGVAIATALMPPLCTAGFGIAIGKFSYFIGAFYLYSINCFFICISTFGIIKYLKYESIQQQNTTYEKRIKHVITFLIFIMIVPSFYLAYSLLKEKNYLQNVDQYIQNEFTNEGCILVYKKVNYKSNPKTIELAFLQEEFDSTKIDTLKNELALYNIKNTTLTIRQNNASLKDEILNEISQQNLQVSLKDNEIKLLTDKLNVYQIQNPELIKEVNILFPEAKDISFGNVQQFITNDSIQLQTIFLYEAEKNIDEIKLKAWLENKLNRNNIIIYNRKHAKV